MNTFYFINKTDDDIEITGKNNERIILRASTSKIYKINESLLNNEMFLVKKSCEKQSFYSKVLGIILSILISVPFFCFNCFKLENISSFIRLPFYFELNNKLDENKTVEIEFINSKENLYSYSVLINGISSNLSIDFSKKELKGQINEYISNNVIIFLVPILFLAVLFVYLLIHKIYIASFVLFFVFSIFTYYCFKTAKENRKILQDIYKIYDV